MNPDPARLRSVAVVALDAAYWHALEPVLDRLAERGFPFGTPVARGSDWVCEYGPLKLELSPVGSGWAVSMAVAEDNVVTRALLKTLDESLRALPGVSRVEWFKREDRSGPPAASPIQA